MSSPVAPQSQPYNGGAVPPSYGPDGTNLPPNPAGLPAYEGSGAAPEKKKGGIGKKIGGIVGLVLVLILIGVAKGAVKSYFRSDPTAEVKVGDCISTDKVTSDKEQDTDARIVTCGGPDATFSVVGRVEKETDTESKSCDKYFTDEKAEYAIVASVIGDGYLLCLKQV